MPDHLGGDRALWRAMAARCLDDNAERYMPIQVRGSTPVAGQQPLCGLGPGIVVESGLHLCRWGRPDPVFAPLRLT